MSAFEDYAQYYDLFYQDKDYVSEAAFVDGILRRWCPGPLEILELGCGTGRHAQELVGLGHSVHGIDLSPGMLGAVPESPGAGRFTCCLGDARTYRDSRRYGAVISLFHVVSYQVTNEDLVAAFATAAAHLEVGGVFVFDAWYGPAVIRIGPDARERTITTPQLEITRTATPTMFVAENRVDVAYHLVVKDRDSGTVGSVDEVHRMRYLFSPEVDHLLGEVGLELVEQCEFLTGGELGLNTWNACFVGMKR